MTTPRAETLFRLSGLIACAFVGLPRLFRAMEVLPEDWRRAGISEIYQAHERLVWWSVLLISVAIVSAIGAAFWKVTDPDARWRTKILLLTAQGLIAMGDSEYLILVAAQLPFSLTPRWAFRWLLVQLTIFASLGLAAYLFPEPIGVPPSPPWNPRSPLAVTYSLGWQVFSFAVGYLAASERRARRELELRNNELLAAEAVLDASSRLAERSRISRELHDTIGHHLTVLSVNLEMLKHVADERSADAVQAAQTVTRLMLADVRDVVTQLQDERAMDLKRALSMLANSTGPPRVHVRVSDDADVGDPACAHAVFRCAQEAITNAVRHAQARHVWIDLDATDRGVELHVRDDGRGAARVTLGNGLRGMRARVEEIGGRLDLSTEPGAGFGIRAWIPAVAPR